MPVFQVVERSQKLREKYRDSKIRQYFYGVKTQLYPHTFEVPFNEIKLYKIGGEYSTFHQIIQNFVDAPPSQSHCAVPLFITSIASGLLG